MHRRHSTEEGGRGERCPQSRPGAGSGGRQIGRVLRPFRRRDVATDEDQVSDGRDDGPRGDDRRDSIGLLGGDPGRGPRTFRPDRRVAGGREEGAEFAQVEEPSPVEAARHVGHDGRGQVHQVFPSARGVFGGSSASGEDLSRRQVAGRLRILRPCHGLPDSSRQPCQVIINNLSLPP